MTTTAPAPQPPPLTVEDVLRRNPALSNAEIGSAFGVTQRDVITIRRALVESREIHSWRSTGNASQPGEMLHSQMCWCQAARYAVVTWTEPRMTVKATYHTTLEAADAALAESGPTGTLVDLALRPWRRRLPFEDDGADGYDDD